MTQQLPDLTQGRATAKQIGGKGVPQQVSPFELGVQTGTPECAPNDAADGGRTRKPLLGRQHPDEYATRLTRRTDITQITGQRGADVRGQWQALQSLALAAH